MDSPLCNNKTYGAVSFSKINIRKSTRFFSAFPEFWTIILLRGARTDGGVFSSEIDGWRPDEESTVFHVTRHVHRALRRSADTSFSPRLSEFRFSRTTDPRADGSNGTDTSWRAAFNDQLFSGRRRAVTVNRPCKPRQPPPHCRRHFLRPRAVPVISHPSSAPTRTTTPGCPSAQESPHSEPVVSAALITVVDVFLPVHIN